MQGIAVLGATGSIGQSTLKVLALHPDKYRVVALTAHKRIEKLVAQAKATRAEILVIGDANELPRLQRLCDAEGINPQLMAGPDALTEVVALPEVDQVMAAIVGAAGLLPTLAAIKANKRVLLANKESLVMSGALFMRALGESDATLLPIDSEHNAIFQALPSDFRRGQLSQSGISQVLLTGSGGPFLTMDIDSLASVTPAQACKHPNWDMGRKISVDSATMMNKGLEYIEACWMFGLTKQDIQVVIHPQSVIHSMVQYVDGSVIAQMGNPDMCTPIAHAMAYPKRLKSGVAPLDFANMKDFSFMAPDEARYPNLRLAIDAFDAGQYACTALNAANEVAVSAFLHEQIRFTDIAEVNRRVVETIAPRAFSGIDEVLALDDEARSLAQQTLAQL